jgi:Holliday junction resolvase RusA-like endonuclease
MPRSFSMRIEGEVGGKGRPRTRVIWQSGKPLATIYPDPDSAKVERTIKQAAFVLMHGKPLFEGPVELVIEIWRQHPVSWSKAVRAANAGYFATGTPDVDNQAKLLMDAFNGTVWTDDKLVSDLVIRRRFSDQPAHVDVTVNELIRPPVSEGLFAQA